jgi:hypothetical protein
MIENYDLPQKKPEMVECLSCEKLFLSWNKAYNRICPQCKNKRSRPQPFEEELYWDDFEDFEIELDPEYPEFFAD